MENKERIKRLRDLKHIMVNHRKIFKEVEFNICTWLDKDNFGERCGTAACALGSAALYGKFKKRGLGFDEKSYGNSPIFTSPTGKIYTSFEAGQEFFGITSDESYFLFDPEEYEHVSMNPVTEKYGADAVENVTPRTVADRVDWLIKKYQCKAKMEGKS